MMARARASRRACRASRGQPFLCLIDDHLEWPDNPDGFYVLVVVAPPGGAEESGGVASAGVAVDGGAMGCTTCTAILCAGAGIGFGSAVARVCGAVRAGVAAALRRVLARDTAGGSTGGFTGSAWCG